MGSVEGPIAPQAHFVSRDIFPDGIKTSGQHEPTYNLLRPYEDFPDHIEGPTVWSREDYVNKPEAWTHRFTDREIEELSKTSDDFIAAEIPLTGISKVRSATQPLYLTNKQSRTIFLFQFSRNVLAHSARISSTHKASSSSKASRPKHGAITNLPSATWA